MLVSNKAGPFMTKHSSFSDGGVRDKGNISTKGISYFKRQLFSCLFPRRQVGPFRHTLRTMYYDI